MIKQFIFLIILIQIGLCQDLIEQTYKQVAIEGSTSAPSFIVLKIENKNTGEIKEICTNKQSMYFSVDTLLKHSKDRFLKIRDTSILNGISFNQYDSKKVERVKNIVSSQNLIDSLMQYDKIRTRYYNEGNSFREIRSKKYYVFRDSVLNNTSLSIEGKSILNDLSNPYFDLYYDVYSYDTLTNDCIKLIDLWKNAIDKDRVSIKSLQIELEKKEDKFFKYYFEKYGITYCHVLFLNGITTYFNCESFDIEIGNINAASDIKCHEIKKNKKN